MRTSPTSHYTNGETRNHAFSTGRKNMSLRKPSSIDTVYAVSISGGMDRDERCEGQDGSQREGKPNWRLDTWNILLLLFLYILQGIPMGLAGSIPMLLQSRHVGYKQQALFSVVSWPFTLKLLYAPIVDSVYSSRIGRRKTWMVPMQYLIGVTMLLLSCWVDALLGMHGEIPDVQLLTMVFFLMYLFAATQDIAVDGWALTMLSKVNIGYASTCNSVGQTTGYFLGFTVFLALESKDFCNRYLRSEPADTGLMTLSDFMFFWGCVFLVTTTLVWMFKKETERVTEKTSIVTTYKELLSIVGLKPVILYALAHVTAKVGFAAPEAATGLKLLEAGVPKEKLALIAVPLMPLQIITPLVLSRFIAGPSPLNLWMKAYPVRIFVGVLFAIVVWFTPMFGSDGDFPLTYYFIIIGVFMLHQVASYSMFVTQMAFHARISDPAIGGTYMTLLNTISNLGANWPGTVALWFLDPLTDKSCQGGKDPNLDCDTTLQFEACSAAGGHCVTQWDGYYTECAVCVLLGLLWYFLWRRAFVRLQKRDLSHWRCSRTGRESVE